MLQFRNDTPFAGTILLLPDVDGVESLFVIVKGTFRLGRGTEVDEEQVPVVRASEHYGAPDETSIRVPSDISLTKPGTDVLLVGHAYAPDGRVTPEMDVSLAVGPVTKRVRVFGDRVWRAGRGLGASRPEPFDRMPLVWELAYGGADPADAALAEPRNPVGRGFCAPGTDEDETHEEFWLPNLEDPAQLISHRRQRPAPACFAPLAPHWEPRRRYAGTYDERWQRERAPYLPDDFDPRFFQLAPPDLVATQPLQGGEFARVLGATPSGVLQFRLPKATFHLDFVVDGAPEPGELVLDTVLIEPDMERLQLTWRASLQCDKRALRVNEVRVGLDELALPTAG